MKDAKSSLKLAQRVTYFLISISLLVMALAPDWKPVAGGLVVGLFGSIAISWHLQWKTAKLATIVAKTQSKPRFNLGFLTRACVGVLAFVVSDNVLQYNFYMTIVGLFFVQLVTIAFIGKSQASVERGETEKWQNT